jgi:hypothetical protein
MAVSKTSDNSLSPYADLLKFGFFNATTWMIGLGTPLVLLASELGASSFEVGLVYAFVFLLMPVQILASIALPRFGYKNQFIFGWITRGIFLLIPLWLAWMAVLPNHERWMVHALIASAFGFSFCRAHRQRADIMPLIYATLPETYPREIFQHRPGNHRNQRYPDPSALRGRCFAYYPIYQAFFWQYTCTRSSGACSPSTTYVKGRGSARSPRKPA